MSILEEQIEEHDGDVTEGLRALGRGLMRGSRADFRQGYTAENAAIAAAGVADREGYEEPVGQAGIELVAHLLGFGDGMKRIGENPDRHTEALDRKIKVAVESGEATNIDTGAVEEAYSKGYTLGEQEDPAATLPG